jgi:hypothetical protein
VGAFELPTPYKFELLAAGIDPLVADDSTAVVVVTALWTIVAGWPCLEVAKPGIFEVADIGFALARPGQDKNASSARAHTIPRPAVTMGLSGKFKSS